MALIRAEIRNRLGSSSIYDGIVEFQSDFENEPMLDSVHYGSMMICLNYDVNDGGDAAASDLYVKREDGSWDRVVTITAGMEGKSAYDVAVENGFDGTEEEWLASLTGNDGTTFTPSVSQSGVLSWTNDDGKQNPQSVDLTAALASSGAVAPLFVVFSKNNYGFWEADKTIAEITSAYNARRPVFFQYGENASEAVHIVDGADNYYVAQMVCSENSTINHYKFFVYNGYGATASVQEIGGGSVTPASIVTATGQMTSQQAATTRENLGAEPEKFVVTVTDDGQGGYTADKTFAQISAAYDAGKIIQAVLEATMFPLISIAYGAFGGGSAMFSATSTPSARATTFTLLCDYDGNNDSWSYYEVGSAIAKDYSRQITANVNITPEDNVVYNCTAAALTSLTITNPPATGEYSIVFTSGSTPTQTTFPATVLGLEDFAAEANTMYEINVLDNRAVVGSWAVSST